MKIKFIVVFLLGFLSLQFLIDQCHELAHCLVAGMVCACHGSKGFSGWTFCPGCKASEKAKALAWLAGPAINYLSIWYGWWSLGPTRSRKEKSLGISFLFASLPLARIVAAMAGGSDETLALRMLFQSPDASNRHLVALGSLLLILALCLPALLRGLRFFKKWEEKLLVFPAFLFLPPWIGKWVSSPQVNQMLTKGWLGEPLFGGIAVVVFIWIVVCALTLFLCLGSMREFLKKGDG
jgi:hypothetical protein